MNIFYAKNPPEGTVWRPAEKSITSVPIILIPFFKGKVKSLEKHIQFFNSIGFSVLTFDYPKVDEFILDKPFSKSGNFGLKSVFADQIENILNSIIGPKIIYVFSNPSSSAIEAVYRRSAIDILGMVCDMGPSGSVWSSFMKYYTFQEPQKNQVKKLALAAVGSALWGVQTPKELQIHLAALPKGFKVLSVRGWKDELIPPADIDTVFSPHTHLDYRTLNLPEAQHLRGLRDYPGDYCKPTEKFLVELANQVNRLNQNL